MLYGPINLDFEYRAGVHPARPLFRLHASFWATSRLHNPELHLHRRHLELHVPQAHRLLVHRVPYERVSRVELVEGRLFTDVIIGTAGGAELVAPGIRRRELALAQPYLAVRTARPCTHS